LQNAIDTHATATVRPRTGALDDGRHHGRQLVAAVCGWIAAVALVVWLIASAGAAELRVSLFLVAVAVVIAVLAMVVAIDVLRPPLMRSRGIEREAPTIDETHDALGRRIERAGPALQAGGEILMEDVGGVRRYVRIGDVA
jgi:hypothetical protein